MAPDAVVNAFSEALWLIVLMVCVIILPSLFVGLIVSVFQAATQINEQTLSFLPRLLATLIAVSVAGPWLVRRMMEHFNGILASIPGMLG
ncbi:flagellar biosynthesis protein FliQ [Litorivicinus lipolyticus]|uniref:Flagellar biosynthetic protein FliQ n=1 Tax=Litorivicinus lipolyticus TaxID=418701 RepID=A0A5Q2QGW2_9GAMM|nr:flagellar biosynthesis protein FliQ [Litorivicinus lipolyticus]QGG80255.1 flagellar biosynthesis protein FliQ [Litorivicinus lipolyticus]